MNRDRCAHGELQWLLGDVYECPSCHAQFRVDDETQPLVQAKITPNPRWTIGEVLQTEVQTDDLKGGYRLRVLSRRPRIRRVLSRRSGNPRPWWRRILG